MPDTSIAGLHHVTALAGPAQAALDFYGGVLGLRRVKTTVNFDDPTTHHLYFGDTRGRPGTVVTFFPWPRAQAGRPGAGMVQSVAFSVPEGSIDAWAARLDGAGRAPRRCERFGATALQFEDPAGLTLELVATGGAEEAGRNGTLPKEQAIRGLHSPTLPVFSGDRTPELLTDVFGWTRMGTEGDRIRVGRPEASRGGAVDLQVRDRHPSGRMGRGAVHHIAFRARDAEAQQEWQRVLRERDIQVTDVKDRHYFQSIYFRDPDWTSGILFEIATDGPGFLEDESEQELGQGLQLPDWLEPRRDELKRQLPDLTPPSDD